MNRRTTVSIAVLTVAALGVVPSQAAPKKKPAPIKGSYPLTLVPDATVTVTGELPGSGPGCGTLPQSIDEHAFSVPAAGTLHVVVDSPDKTPANAPMHADWDIYVLDAAGDEVDSSTSPVSHEETTTKLKKKQALTFKVCNLTGEPDGTVSYTFTYA